LPAEKNICVKNEQAKPVFTKSRATFHLASWPFIHSFIKIPAATPSKTQQQHQQAIGIVVKIYLFGGKRVKGDHSTAATSQVAAATTAATATATATAATCL